MASFNIKFPSMIPPTEAEKGYIAGFLDGEGVISVNATGSCYIQFTNTNIEVLKWIHSKLKVGKIHLTHKIKSIKHKKCYTTMVTGEEAKSVLQKLIPYLIIKKRQAELVLSYPVRHNEGGRPVPYIICQQRREVVRELRILNKRGTSPLNIEPIEIEPQLAMFS